MWGSNSQPRDQKSHALLPKPARRPSVCFSNDSHPSAWEVLSYCGFANDLLKKTVTSPRKSRPHKHGVALKATLAKAFWWWFHSN